MKQPELGQRILELRKQKGLTQEELVEQCNINVRTIQRIEAGEVTPRSFTLKTILNALGENLDNLKESESQEVEILDSKQIHSFSFHIQLAWICGIIYFLSGFIEFAVDYARFYDEELIVSRGIYISLKFIVLLAYIYFMRGFILSGKIFDNYLLKIGSFFLIATAVLFYGYDMASLYFDPFNMEYVLVTQSVFYGIGSFIFGFALLRLLKPMGKISQIAGGLEIASGVFFVMVFMAWLGYLFLIPSVLLQSILLYKVGEYVKNVNLPASSL